MLTVVPVCVCLSVPAALLAALHLCESVRDLQRAAASRPHGGAVHLAASQQRFPQPLDHLPDPGVSK